MLVENGYSILTFIREVSHSLIDFGLYIQSEYGQRTFAMNANFLLPLAVEVIETEPFVCLCLCVHTLTTESFDLWSWCDAKCFVIDDRYIINLIYVCYVCVCVSIMAKEVSLRSGFFIYINYGMVNSHMPWHPLSKETYEGADRSRKTPDQEVNPDQNVLGTVYKVQCLK